MPLRSLAFLLYFFGSSTAAFVYPMVALVCYVAVYHIYPKTTWWGGALEPLGIRYSFICGICLIIGTTLNASRLRFGRQFLHPVEIGSIVVFLTMLLSLGTGVGSNNQTVQLIDKMGKVLIFLLIMSHLVVSRQRLWILTLLFTAMTLYLGHEAKNAPPGAFLKNRLDGIGGPDFRESAGLAIHLCAMMPFVAIVLWQKRWQLRLLAFFAAAYGANAVLLCRARSAFVGCIAAAIFALVYAPRRFRRWITVMLVLAAVGVFTLSDYWFWERMDTIVVKEGEQRDPSSAVRLQIWAAAWEMFKVNPMGVGVGQFPVQIKRYSDELQNTNRDAHNTFILCVGETGALGLLAFVSTMILSWHTLGHASRRARSHLSDHELYDWYILANRLALVVYTVAGLFVSRFYVEAMWWLLMLPVCIARAVENEIRQEVHEENLIRHQLSEWIDNPRPAGVQMGGI